MNTKTKNMVGVALFSAIVVVLQVVFGKVTVGPASINPVLVPVVVGAAVYGWGAGALLGLVSGIAILITGASEPFFTFNPIGTVIVVLMKGVVSGFAAGLIYKLLSKKSSIAAVICAAAVCPVVNTGIFLLGCRVFFWDTIISWAAGKNVVIYMVTGLAGINFLVELGLNLVLSPVIARLIKLGKN